jgi:hypothetical protein
MTASQEGGYQPRSGYSCRTVRRPHLGDVDYRVAGRPEERIKLKLAGDHGNDDALNATAVEGVSLDDQYGPAKSRLGATKFGQIGPPDLAALDIVHRSYQELLSSDLS